MHGDILLVVLILTLGCAAFIFGVIYLVCKFFGFVGRGVVSVFTRHPSTGSQGHQSGSPGVRVCPREQCRKTEYRPARFCSRCGAPFPDVPPGG